MVWIEDRGRGWTFQSAEFRSGRWSGRVGLAKQNISSFSQAWPTRSSRWASRYLLCPASLGITT